MIGAPSINHLFFQDVIPDATPGCSFVIDANCPSTVRDFRLYVDKEFRGAGYGFMATTFLKAYLFPWHRGWYTGEYLHRHMYFPRKVVTLFGGKKHQNSQMIRSHKPVRYTHPSVLTMNYL